MSIPGSDPKKKILGYALAAVFPLICVWLFFHHTYRPMVFRAYRSPDGRYELTVYRTPSFHLVAKPEEWSKDPGYISLVRKANEREIHRKEIRKVDEVKEVLWGPESVEIPHIDAWFLPR